MNKIFVLIIILLCFSSCFYGKIGNYETSGKYPHKRYSYKTKEKGRKPKTKYEFGVGIAEQGIKVVEINKNKNMDTTKKLESK